MDPVVYSVDSMGSYLFPLSDFFFMVRHSCRDLFFMFICRQLCRILMPRSHAETFIRRQLCRRRICICLVPVSTHFFPVSTSTSLPPSEGAQLVFYLRHLHQYSTYETLTGILPLAPQPGFHLLGSCFNPPLVLSFLPLFHLSLFPVVRRIKDGWL